MKKIFMITESGYPVVGGGGLENQITTISSGLLKRGIKVRVIAPISNFSPNKIVDEHEGIEIYRISYPQIRVIGTVVFLLSLALHLLRNRSEYIALHCQGAHNTAAIGCLIGRLVGKPVVVKLTGWWEIEYGILKSDGINLHIRFLRWATKKATYYQTISGHLARLLEERGYSKAKIIRLPNAVDTARFDLDAGDSANSLHSQYDFKLIGLFTGRLVPEKGLNLLIDAWVEAFGPDEDSALLIVGEGDLDEALQEKINDHNRQHQIFLTGSTADVQPYLAIADYGLLTSFNEGLSNTLLEFMSNGLPVIGSRISGTEDVIKHGENGWLYTSVEVQELTKSLLELKSKSKQELQKMGHAGRAFITEYAGVGSVAERLASLYESTNEPTQ
ncbi:MAG: glycosyltransferase family 4 protein [Pseudomonadota bacterium]